MEDFIGRYECTNELCDRLIVFYNEHKQYHTSGIIGSNYKDPDFKESTDLMIHRENAQIPVIEEYLNHLQKCVEDYMKTYPYLKKLYKFGLLEPFIIQHYKVGGGFKKDHCERVGTFDFTIKRVLVFMTYLNDVSDGGTHFTCYNSVEKAEKGKTIIFPADWTHTHRGQISNTQEKTIATGWLSHEWDAI